MNLYHNFPVQYSSVAVKDYDKDIAYFQRIYSTSLDSINNAICKECDKLDYIDSFIYDEYPDKVSLRLVTDRIFNKIYEEDNFSDNLNVASLSNDYRYSGCQKRGVCNPECRNCNQNPNYLRSIVEVLLLNEIMKRRHNHRRNRRWY